MTKPVNDETAKPSWPRKLWDAFATFAAADAGEAAYVADRVAEVEARLLEIDRQFGLSTLGTDDHPVVRRRRLPTTNDAPSSEVQ